MVRVSVCVRAFSNKYGRVWRALIFLIGQCIVQGGVKSELKLLVSIGRVESGVRIRMTQVSSCMNVFRSLENHQINKALHDFFSSFSNSLQRKVSIGTTRDTRMGTHE